MSYTPPTSPIAVDFVAGSYTPPTSPVDAFFAPTLPVGTGAALVSITAAGVGEAGSPIYAAGAALVGVVAAGVGKQAVTGTAAATVGVVGAVVAVHPRYSLKGEVRDGGVLVNRRVRVYTRSDGELFAEQDTTLGAFDIPAGFSEDEFYLVPINLDPSAEDWSPPCANRVLSVLAAD